MLEYKLQDLKHTDGSSVYTWDCLDFLIKNSNGYLEKYKLFYKHRFEHDKKIIGFNAFFVEICGCRNENVYINLIFEAKASYDGLRHLWFATTEDQDDDRNGYLFYPNTNAIIKGLELLNEFCVKYGLHL